MNFLAWPRFVSGFVKDGGACDRVSGDEDVAKLKEGSERAVFNRAMGNNGAAVMAWRHIFSVIAM